MKSAPLAAVPASAAPAPSPVPAPGAQPAAPKKPYRRAAFAPTGAPTRISDNLFRFEDTCQVYIVKDGKWAL